MDITDIPTWVFYVVGYGIASIVTTVAWAIVLAAKPPRRRPIRWVRITPSNRVTVLDEHRARSRR